MAVGFSAVTYKKSKKYVDDTLIGMGAIKGASCQVGTPYRGTESGKSGTYIPMLWEDNEGADHITPVFVPDGEVGKVVGASASISDTTDIPTVEVTMGGTASERTFAFAFDGLKGETGKGIASIVVPDPEEAKIRVNYTDGTSSDLIPIPTVNGKDGKDGEDGFSPTITVNTNTPTVYKLDITDVNGKFTTPNLRGGGSGGSANLTQDLTATVDVGGVSSGDEFSEGDSIEHVIRSILAPTLYPTFSAPSASITYSADTYVAVSGTIPSKTATLTYNAGAIILNGEKQADRGGVATGFSVATTGADTEYSDTSESSGAFNVPALTRSTKGTIKLTGTVSYAQGAQPKDSDGNDYESPLPAGSVSAEKTVTFILPFYYGVSNTSTIADFTGMAESVTAKGNKSFTFTTNNQHMVVAYDSAYGNLKSILDPNGFEVISGWTKSTLTVDGFSYFVYVADSKTTDTNATFTFKF